MCLRDVKELVIQEISKGFREQTILNMEFQGCTRLDLDRKDVLAVKHSNWENGMGRPKDGNVEGKTD